MKKTVLGSVGLVALGFILWGALFAARVLSPVDLTSKESFVLEVQKGQSPREIAKILEEKGIIQNARDFLWLGRMTGMWNKFKAGEYEVSPSMSQIEILKIVSSGISLNHPLTIREGENMYEVGDDLDRKGMISKSKFISLCKDPVFIRNLGFEPPLPPTLEGYLYPETYFFSRTQTPEDMIRVMVKRSQNIWGPKEVARAADLGLTKHQVMTLASVIEKETGAAFERPIISSVFHNRLKKRMRLQSDPTTIYGIWERYKGNIHKSDLLEKTAYNTYQIPALPIGPISNPSKEAVNAALYPAESTYLFFVSQNDGTHAFTGTVAEHNEAVRKYQLNAAARAGKSWRDLSKKSAE